MKISRRVVYDRIGVLGNKGTYQRMIGGTGNKTKICRGNNGAISLFSGNPEHYKRLGKMRFLHMKTRLTVDFAKFVNWYNKIHLRFLFMTSALCPRRLPPFFLGVIS